MCEYRIKMVVAKDSEKAECLFTDRDNKTKFHKKSFILVIYVNQPMGLFVVESCYFGEKLVLTAI